MCYQRPEGLSCFTRWCGRASALREGWDLLTVVQALPKEACLVKGNYFANASTTDPELRPTAKIRRETHWPDVMDYVSRRALWRFLRLRLSGSPCQFLVLTCRCPMTVLVPWQCKIYTIRRHKNRIDTNILKQNDLTGDVKSGNK